MKISIITICFNSERFLEDAIKSVATQDYPDIEYIVIDGASTDGTVDVINRCTDKIDTWISEKDNGIYDAMNKGVQMATGDVVGILNSDDIYNSHDIVSQVANSFVDQSIEAVFGNIYFVSPDNMDKPVRTYSAKGWHPDKFVWGYMPPHPSFFVRRKWYDKLGLYKTDYRIASDYELLIRFLKVNKLKYKYLPLNMVKMRTGGASTKNLKSNIVLNAEILRACRENNLSTNYLKIYSKYFKKVFELVNHS